MIGEADSPISAKVTLLRYIGWVATIQIRDIPDEAYETIRLRARAAGQSIQAYMRDQVVMLAKQRTKREVLDALEAVLAKEGTPVTLDDIVADLDADRR